MIRKTVLAMALGLSLIATGAQAMSVRDFLTTAAGIPRNPTALLRSDTGRLLAELRGATKTVRDEQVAAQRAGRRSATCMPERVSLDSGPLLARFNAIPPERRNISVTQAMREWMAERYPCPTT